MNHPDSRFRRAVLFLAGTSALLAGCAAAPSRDDPFEPWNRAMYEVHQVVDGHVVKPIATKMPTQRSIAERFIRHSLPGT